MGDCCGGRGSGQLVSFRNVEGVGSWVLGHEAGVRGSPSGLVARLGTLRGWAPGSWGLGWLYEAPSGLVVLFGAPAKYSSSNFLCQWHCEVSLCGSIHCCSSTLISRL